jgi:hypothetical protein
VTVTCGVCGMKVDADKAGRLSGKFYCDMPGLPCKLKLEGKP